MKKENLYFILLLLLLVVGGVIVNYYMIHSMSDRDDEIVMVSLNRLKHELEECENSGRPIPENLSAYEGVRKISAFDQTEFTDTEKLNVFFAEQEGYCLMFSTGKTLYKIEYDISTVKGKRTFIATNIIFAVLFLVLLFIYYKLRKNILKPMKQITELPFELAKGNLSIPLKKDGKGAFGHFLWGMNLLRETMEENKNKNLELQKEKKVLLMSLSHDIKTPLSAIKLYVSALSKGLYKDEEKQKEIAEKLNEKTDEIERYMAEIVHASNEDFLHFEVNNSSFYSKELFERIHRYYDDKMTLNQIDFMLKAPDNCVLYGDLDRMEEVLQNLIENAIKYGDGKKIRLDAYRDEDSYIITVRNTGTPIAAKELPHMFDSFFRGSNVKKQAGSGLGLYICRQLMHRMDGEILAELAADEESGQKLMQIKVVVRMA